MKLGRACLDDKCGGNLFETFKDGITNGAAWYPLFGGMQDWNYWNSNTLEITVELSCLKYPYLRDLPKYWNDNKVSLLTFMNEVHKGVKGFVLDEQGRALGDAKIHVSNISHTVFSSKDGDYWRLLVPGKYSITVSKEGFRPLTKIIEVPTDTALEVCFNFYNKFNLHLIKINFNFTEFNLFEVF